jgi:Sulfatase
MKGIIVTLFCIGYLLTNFACNSSKAVDLGNNVILVTLDGVRWQEVFHGTDPKLDQGRSESMIFKNLNHEFGISGLTMGDRQSGSEMTVSNPVNISLPAYQSIMAGFPQNCFSNSCDRTPAATLQERILSELNLKKDQVVTFASWNAIALAVEHEAGRTTVNAGDVSFEDETIDPEVEKLNNAQTRDRAIWSDVRYDKHTFAQALYYLKKHQPRFLYISLDDSDEWGHQANYPEYVKTLHQYDDWMKELLNTLPTLGKYGQSTSVLITTDHGRGNGERWKDHGPSLPESKFIWLFARTPGLKSGTTSSQGYSHVDIRPTIEALMGLTPTSCENCGRVISELAH